MFVVPISFSTYLFFVFIAVCIGLYIGSWILTVVIVLYSLFILYKYPKETIGLVLLLVSLIYWQISLPLLVVCIIGNYFFGPKDNVKGTEPELLQIKSDSKNNSQHDTDASSTP
jgi:hypothetical protein